MKDLETLMYQLYFSHLIFEAKRYEGAVKDGGILLSVHCDSDEWAEKAKDTLELCHAENVSTTSESSSDTGSGEKPHLQAGNF